jgi:hypothetical protein
MSQTFRWQSGASRAALHMLCSRRMAREHCVICHFPIPAVPRSWRGPLDSFLSQFIKPRLATRSRIEAWSRWVVKGATSGGVVVVRAHGALARAETTHVDGIEVRPSDLSPVWAVQQTMLHSDPPTEISFAEWARSLPVEHNVVRQCRMDLLNRAGFHTAHMFDVAAYRTRSSRSLGNRMRDACLIELHPLNVFWVPKPRWQHWGAHTQVKAHFADLMRTYVPDAWQDFIDRIGAKTEQFEQPDPSFEYVYTEEDWTTRADRQFSILRSSTTIRTPQVRQMVSLVDRSGLTQITETQLREVLEQGKASGQFDTTQDVMLVFNFYRKRLKDDGVLGD